MVKRLLEDEGCLGCALAMNSLSGVVAAVLDDAALDSLKEKLQLYEHIFGFKAVYYSISDSKSLSVKVVKE